MFDHRRNARVRVSSAILGCELSQVQIKNGVSAEEVTGTTNQDLATVLLTGIGWTLMSQGEKIVQANSLLPHRQCSVVDGGNDVTGPQVID
jgi:hypothetical protein